MAGEYFESETIIDNTPKIRYYYILNISEIDKIDFDSVLETSKESIRTSIDGTLTFVSYNNNEPDCLKILETKQGPYSEYQLSNILNSNVWIDEQLKIEKNI